MSLLRVLKQFRRSSVLAVACLCLWVNAAAQTPALPVSPATLMESSTGPNSPLRLRQPPAPSPPQDRAPPTPSAPAVVVQGEFERFVQSLSGEGEVRRFGAELVTQAGESSDGEANPLVPADYVIGPGDEVVVTLWGSIDADLRLVVDRTGRINMPRVGAIQVSGVRHADLADVVTRRVGQVFRGFESSVTLGQLRGIRVFVTGFASRPGSYTVSSLSTLLGALMRAGGPSSAGSFRHVELRRGQAMVARFDLYDLLLKGDRSADRTLQSGDVVHVGPVGTQVAIIGSVHKPAVVELGVGDTVDDIIRMAGGFTAVADRTRLAVERLRDRNAGRVAQLELPRDAGLVLSYGDVLRAFSAVSALLPQEKQAKRVKVEGEVARPGEYVLSESSSVRDAIRAAGGLTKGAYLFATELTRVSVQRTQQANYERALRDMETDLARQSGSQRVSTAEDAVTQTARNASTDRLIDRLRSVRPSGRIVLEMSTDAGELPDLALEDGDRIHIPPRSTTVGVFGSVFNAAAYLHAEGRSVGDYLRLGGGPKKGADEGGIFVVRANGSVVSGRQKSGWFAATSNIESMRTEPGDTIFVPEEMDKSTFVQAAKDWTQILYQFGLGIAGLKSATR